MNLNPVTVGVNNIEPASKIGVKTAEYTYTSHIGNTPTPWVGWSLYSSSCLSCGACILVLVLWCLSYVMWCLCVVLAFLPHWVSGQCTIKLNVWRYKVREKRFHFFHKYHICVADSEGEGKQQKTTPGYSSIIYSITEAPTSPTPLTQRRREYLFPRERT